jgi:hypothetical protein
LKVPIPALSIALRPCSCEACEPYTGRRDGLAKITFPNGTCTSSTTDLIYVRGILKVTYTPTVKASALEFDQSKVNIGSGNGGFLNGTVVVKGS